MTGYIVEYRDPHAQHRLSPRTQGVQTGRAAHV